MNFTGIFKAATSGITSGLFLGLSLKLVEYLTHLKVYTLLLNVDYVPVLKNYKIGEVGEFSLHLVISIILAISVHIYLLKKDWGLKRKKKFVIMLSIVIGVLLYPTTMFSERTPEITSTSAFLFWIIAHTLYGRVLALMLTKVD